MVSTSREEAGNRADGRAESRQELADRIRQEHLRGSGRRRVQAMVLVVLLVVAAIGLLLWMQFRAHQESVVTAPQNATEEYGFLLTPALKNGTEPTDATPVRVVTYEDFLCPSCGIFHTESSPFLAEQVAAGAIELEYRPISFLVNASTDEYSQRAANAAVCVADQAGVVAYAAMHDLLLANQPAEGGAGLSDEQLIDFATQAGAEGVDDCVTERTFWPWIEEATAAGLAADVHETPTVRVNGQNVVRSDNGKESMPGPPELQYAIEAVS